MSCCLILDEKHDVLVVLDEAEPGEELLHDALVEALDHSELLVLGGVLEHVLLDLFQGIIFVVKDADGDLVGIIVEIDEAIVQEEATVALLSIAVVDLLTALDVIERFNDEASPVVSVVPCSLSRSLVVEHVCVGHEAVGLHSINLDAKDTTRHHHANL